MWPQRTNGALRTTSRAHMKTVHRLLNCYDSAVAELLIEHAQTDICLDGPTADGLDRIGFALADPIRRDILVRLGSGSECPSDLAEAIGTSRSNVSNHLACLRGCGLITAERAGRHLHYQLCQRASPRRYGLCWR